MTPHGVEIRTELQLTDTVLAFGFTGEHVSDDVAGRVLVGELVDYITRTAAALPTRFVVIDMRNVGHLSSVGIGRLLTFQRGLQQGRWALVLLINDAVVRDVFAATNLDRLFSVVTDEAELRDLVNCVSPATGLQPAACEGPMTFSEDEIADMDATGVTLDEAIRVIERLRA